MRDKVQPAATAGSKDLEDTRLFGIKHLTDAFGRLWKRKTALPQSSPQKMGTLPRAASMPQVAVMAEAETPGGTNQLDDNLKKRIRDLGDAINQSLSDSEPIAEAIGNIKNQGYEVFLVLEATIGFTKNEEEAAEPAGAMVTADGKTAEPKFRVTAQDMKFLKSLRIGLGD